MSTASVVLEIVLVWMMPMLASPLIVAFGAVAAIISAYFLRLGSRVMRMLVAPFLLPFLLLTISDSLWPKMVGANEYSYDLSLSGGQLLLHVPGMAHLPFRRGDLLCA